MQTYLEQREAVLRFDQVTDPRDRRGRRWPLTALLSGALVSMVLLARSLRRAEQHTEDLASTRLLRRLGIRRRISDSTLGEVVARVAPLGTLGHLHMQIRTEHRRKALGPELLPVGVIAVDGKTPSVLKEAANPYFCQPQRTEGGAERYLYGVLNATLVSSRAAVCIHQEPIPAWTNEVGHFGAFFDNLCKAYSRLDLFEVVTSDAGVLSEAHCRKLHNLGLGYVVALKGNNPSLELEARRLLDSLAETEPPVATDDGWECDSSRGWIKRELWTCTEIAGWPGWERLRQLWLVRVLRRDGKDGPVRVLEQRQYATNLPVAHRLRGKHILTLVRAHWRIENELHGTLARGAGCPRTELPASRGRSVPGASWLRPHQHRSASRHRAQRARHRPGGPPAAQAAHQLAAATRLAPGRDRPGGPRRWPRGRPGGDSHTRLSQRPLPVSYRPPTANPHQPTSVG